VKTFQKLPKAPTSILNLPRVVENCQKSLKISENLSKIAESSYVCFKSSKCC